ncbi:efflux transporter outer membrane subunit [Burkholderia ambifaria]|uniref:efflux transporter outer membrane subunit n=1 Tax=Burkholderia ambifaria TaxID=152480 RepID=UPI001B9937DB|nr:efflux transporter outer membrane subunit [Burkholderia ambifaria]MBR8176440.1 efflux transporter outer membrane subunit [Burkholderia ambifaria]
MKTLDIEWLSTSPAPIRNDSRIEAGAHLVSERDGYAHHGIYAGNGLVIHYGGFHRSARRCPVECVPLYCFAANKGIRVQPEPGAAYTGMTVVERARSRLGEDRYQLLTNNCEHFCTWCVRGVGRSEQVRRSLRNPWMGIRTLFALANEGLASRARMRSRCRDEMHPGLVAPAQIPERTRMAIFLQMAFVAYYVTRRAMNIFSIAGRHTSRVFKAGVPAIVAAGLSACVNYAGIHGDAAVTEPRQYATQQSLPFEQGHWPTADWADQFGDGQLKSLIDEALKGSPTLAQARARVAAAQAYSESARTGTMPRIDASYALTRQQFSGTALVPPPYGGSWQTENRGILGASYELDLWGKKREALKASVSTLQASRADAETVRLTLTTSIARTYNELARLHLLHDIAQQEIDRREKIDRIAAGRIATGLDTQVERETARANLATSRASLKSLDGRILATRYQIAALLGAGPDRGLRIARPMLGIGNEVRLPDNLPADLVSRRPDIVAARWRVDALAHDVKEAKAEFYPDINLSAAIGLDAFGFGRFLTAASRTASIGPAIHLPIFDAGALRAQLKGRYADFDNAVAAYNQALVTALSEVATQIADVRSTDAQLVDAQTAQQAAQKAAALALAQYKAGLTNQLTVLNADVNALSAAQGVANLRMDRRDRQIALASALGGGFIDTSFADSGAAARADVPVSAAPAFAAR